MTHYEDECQPGEKNCDYCGAALMGVHHDQCRERQLDMDEAARDYDRGF